MLLDADELDGDLDTDVCIIGAGPAGITIAHELSGRRFSVCLLESGGLELDPQSIEDSGGEIAGVPYFPLHKARARGFGGSSFLWPKEDGLRSRQLDPIDFESRPGVRDSGWPFSFDVLSGHYRRAHEVARLGPPRYDVAAWSDPENTPALNLEDTPFGTTMFRFGEDTSVFRSRRQEFERSSNLRVVLHATVEELNRSEEATRIDRVTVTTRSGKSISVTARLFVLATGGIENARLLLASRDANPAGLGNQHDLVGRYFQEHLRIHSGVLVPTDHSLMDRLGLYRRHFVDGAQTTGVLVLSEETLRREGLLNSAIYLRSARLLETTDAYRSLAVLKRGSKASWGEGDTPIAPHVARLARRPLNTAATIGRMAARQLGRPVVQLSLQTEQAPNPSSRVMLGERRAHNGRHLPKLEWRLTELDIRSARKIQQMLDAAVKEAGIGYVTQMLGDEQPPIPIRGFWHHIGTTRMSAEPQKGVVDPHCRIHGATNVYVAGSSIFPTGGYANPTLTVVALSLRLADHLRKLLSPGREVTSVP